MVQAIIAMLLWAVWGFFSALASARIGSAGAFYNALSLLPVVIITLILTNRFAHPLNIWGITFGVLAGVASGLAAYFYYRAMGTVPANTVNIIVSAYPAVTFLLTSLFLGESVTPAKVIGTVLVIVGVIILSTG